MSVFAMKLMAACKVCVVNLEINILYFEINRVIEALKSYQILSPSQPRSYSNIISET